MILFEPHTDRRIPIKEQTYDLIVVGGGLTGVACALAAARSDLQVALIQNRPVLGGNASSEIRVWALGATSHMGNNNRWAREGGIVDEILTENVYRNKEGNPVLFDMLLMDKVLAEKNISLYLNTSVYDISMKDRHSIAAVWAFNVSSEMRYHLSAPLFADCSGDGILGFLAGASFRIGTETKQISGEGLAPAKDKGQNLLGDSILFYTKKTDAPVAFTAPSFALPLDQIEQIIPKLKDPNYLNVHQHGCKFWWLEYGGTLDTIHDTEQIKYELWRIVYGVWNYIKNSGRFPEMANYTIEWVGTIPGKRESRRFMGYYTLTQQDVMEQTSFYDAVAYGGWAIDLHPVNAVYSNNNSCHQLHSQGVYTIPYRCYVSKEIDNLFLGGRLISATQVAHGSTRVMCTCALGGEVIGTAAAIVHKNGNLPKDLIDKDNIGELQNKLLRNGCFIPGVRGEQLSAENMRMSVSSTTTLYELPEIDVWQSLSYPMGLMFPGQAGVNTFKLHVRAEQQTSLHVELRASKREYNFTPNNVLAKCDVEVQQGDSWINVPLSYEAFNGFVLIAIDKNEQVQIAMSDTYLPAVTTLYNYQNPAVSNFGVQVAPANSGVDSFEFWCPKRRPESLNMAIHFEEPLLIYGTSELESGYHRPYLTSNCWVASQSDSAPEITVHFDEPQEIKGLTLFFDTDFDQALEPIQMGHYDLVSPLCVRQFAIYDENKNCIWQQDENHSSTRCLTFDSPVKTKELTIRLNHPSAKTPAALYGLLINK